MGTTVKFVLLSMIVLVACSIPDYAEHECTRTCGEEREARVCRYRWVLETYLTLSRACYDCPNNKSDCWRDECVSADGIQRTIRVANRMLPGPSIQVCEGDVVEVEVLNQMAMAEGVSIHWHGILQRKSPYMDGVAMVTQCPIPASSSFLYKFLAEDPGTHLWHSHAGLYRGDGLFGSVVVRQPPSRDPHYALYDFDLPEHVIVVNDWTHQQVVDVFAAFYHSNRSQQPDSILINGRGVYKPSEHKVQDQGVTPFAVFYVQAFKRYRFRVVSAGSLKCPIQIFIDNHDLLLIASDGRPLRPFIVNSFLIFSGERYDFVLTAKGDHNSSYWIHAKGLDECETNSVEQLAILQYHSEGGDTAPIPENSLEMNFDQNLLYPDLPDEYDQLNSMTSLEPDDESLVETPDHRFYLEFAYRFRNNTHFHNPALYPVKGRGYKSMFSAMINNISNVLPPTPLLTQFSDIEQDLFCNSNNSGSRCDTEFCECIHRLVVTQGDVIEIVIVNANNISGFTHPLHLHGYSYRVVAVNSTEDMSVELFRDLDRQGQIWRRLHHPPAKDTVPIPNCGYVVLRLKASNPGVWFMHCHVLFHSEIGMALTLQVNQASGNLPASPPDFPRCGSWPSVPYPRAQVKSGSNSHHLKQDEDEKMNKVHLPQWVVPVIIGLCVSVATLVALLLRPWVKGQSQQPRRLRVYSSLTPSSACVEEIEVLASDDENRSLL